MQLLTTATLWEWFRARADGAPMRPAHTPDVQLRVIAPVTELHPLQHGLMLFRR